MGTGRGERVLTACLWPDRRMCGSWDRSSVLPWIRRGHPVPCQGSLVHGRVGVTHPGSLLPCPGPKEIWTLCTGENPTEHLIAITVFPAAFAWKLVSLLISTLCFLFPLHPFSILFFNFLCACASLAPLNFLLLLPLLQHFCLLALEISYKNRTWKCAIEQWWWYKLNALTVQEWLQSLIALGCSKRHLLMWLHGEETVSPKDHTQWP